MGEREQGGEGSGVPQGVILEQWLGEGGEVFGEGEPVVEGRGLGRDLGVLMPLQGY